MPLKNEIEKYDEFKRMTTRMHLTDDGRVKRVEFILDEPMHLVDFSIMRIVAPAPPAPRTPQGMPSGAGPGPARAAPKPCSGGNK